jgi:hypothetical protein
MILNRVPITSIARDQNQCVSEALALQYPLSQPIFGE